MNRLAYAERAVIVAREQTACAGGQHAAGRLEDLVAVELPECLSHTRKPARKVAPGGLAARRNANRFDELAIREEQRLLTGMLEPVGVIEIAGALREVRRVRDVQRFAFGVLEFFEGQRRLAATGATNDNQRRRPAIDLLLCVVEGNRLVEEMDRRVLRMQVAHGLCFLHRLLDTDLGNPVFVDRRTTQEARLVVIMVGDHFEHQRADLVAVAKQRKQQPIGVVESGAVELPVAQAGQLLDLCRAKVVAGNGVMYLAVAGLDARGIEARVLENFHGISASDGRAEVAQHGGRKARQTPASPASAQGGRKQGLPENIGDSNRCRALVSRSRDFHAKLLAVLPRCPAAQRIRTTR